MSRTLKQMLNEVLGRSAFVQRTAFANSTDPEDVQMVAFANKAATEIMRYIPWPTLRKTKELTLVDGQLEYDLPDDFLGYVPETMWKNLGSREVQIPAQDRLWGWFQSGAPGRGIHYYAKFIRGQLEFQSVQDGETITYDYISNKPILNGVDYKQYFDNDSDTFLLDEESLISGTKAYWQIEKQMDGAQAAYADFRQTLQRAVSADVGMKSINPNRPVYRGPISSQYLR